MLKHLFTSFAWKKHIFLFDVLDAKYRKSILSVAKGFCFFLFRMSNIIVFKDFYFLLFLFWSEQIIAILTNKLPIKSLLHPNSQHSFNCVEKIKGGKSLDVQVKGSMVRNVGVIYMNWCIATAIGHSRLEESIQGERYVLEMSMSFLHSYCSSQTIMQRVNVSRPHVYSMSKSMLTQFSNAQDTAMTSDPYCLSQIWYFCSIVSL